MFSKKAKKSVKKGFTLIEMLIVIVIIGILAAALIPRLASARGRANDVARKADLAQVAAALVSYQIDHGNLPATPTSASLIGISGDLISAGMNSIPYDPNSARLFSGINGVNVTLGQYGYTTIYKSGVPANGFVLMAATETEGGSNRVTNGSFGNIPSASGYNEINLCKTFTKDDTQTTPKNDGTGLCFYNSTKDQLRYIYLY